MEERSDFDTVEDYLKSIIISVGRLLKRVWDDGEPSSEVRAKLFQIDKELYDIEAKLEDDNGNID